MSKRQHTDPRDSCLSAWLSTGILIVSLAAALTACATPSAGQPSVTATPSPPPPSATPEAPASVEIPLVPLANPVAGYRIAYPQGWVYSADVEDTYIAQDDTTLRSGSPVDGAMVLVMSRPVRGLEQDLGDAEVTAEAVFQWVALNLFRNRGALIGATEPRAFGRAEGVGGQVMWVDAERSARIQGYLSAVVAEGMATVVLGMIEDTRWNTTWPLFDAMLGSLELTPPMVYGQIARGALTTGQPASAELTAGWSDGWTYTSPGGEYVAASVQAIAQRWDPFLEIYDAQGRLLASDDNGGAGFDARLGAVWLGASGTYTLYVSGSAGAGPYEIRVAAETPPERPIRFDQTQSAAISSPDECHVWTFEGGAGDAVDITLTPQDGLDGVVDLVAPDGRAIALSDDPQLVSARILGLVLPEDGLYRLIAHSANDTSGPYQLSLTRLVPQGGGALTYGSPVGGTILPAQSHTWTFEGAQGNLVTIEMGAPVGELDCRLELLGPDGSQLAADDNSGPGRDALIEGYRLMASGTYSVVARAGEDAAGHYVLSVAPTQVRGSLAYGQTVTDTLGPGEHHNWLFEGRAGDPITLTLTSVVSGGPSLDGYLELFALDAQRLALDDDSAGQGNARIAGFVLPADGVYRVAAMGYLAEDEGAYALTLARNGG